MSDCTSLRERLTALRDDVLRQIAESDVLDGGLLRLAADAVVILVDPNAKMFVRGITRVYDSVSISAVCSIDYRATKRRYGTPC